jgi:23S rRNA (uracil1939-C5)-methyltransferase
MAIGEVFELAVERLTSEGAGVGRADGRIVFVEGAAPAERVVAEIYEEKAGFSRGRLRKVAEPSAARVEPVCPLFGECGGCVLQHVAYPEQLEQKRAWLRDAFSRIGGFSETPEIRAVPSEPYGYRNRMQFHRVKKNAAVGLKRRSGNQAMPVGDCPIAEAGIRAALRAGTLAVPPWTDRYRVFSRNGLFLSEGGTERGETAVLGKTLKLDVVGFFQSNVGMLEKLLEELLETAGRAADAGSGKRALDLYCGVGTFGAFLVDYFPALDLVELDKRAAALARENVKGPGVRLFAFSDDDWARRREVSGEAYAFAVVDPPRVGLSAALRKRLVESPPATLAYVSCDPATLARDAKELCAGPYDLQSLSLYDFYPQTPHIESLAVFGRRQ